MNLIATGTFEQRLNINKRSIIMKTLEFGNSLNVILPRDGDIFDIKAIQFINPSNNFNFESLSIEIGGNEIIRLDKDLCALIYNNKYQKFKNIETIDDNRVLTYNLPWEELRLKNVIKCISLQFHQIIIKLNYDGQCENSKLYYYYTYLQNQDRSLIVQNNHDMKIEQLFCQEMNHTINSREHILLFNGLGNGLFINNLDISKINNLKIKLNNIIYIELNKYNIKTFVRELNDMCFYLPFGDNLDFANDDYNNSINFSRFENVILELDYNMEDFEYIKFKVGMKSMNIFRIASGLSCMMFLISNSNVNLMQNRIENKRENKKITGDIFCGIKYSNINENEEYFSCDVCHKNFSYDVSRQWIEIRKKCPICIQPWTNFTIYTNYDE